MKGQRENPYADPSTFRLPNATQRSIVIGRTGSGKTVFMRWLLSMQNIDAQPWYVFDYKQAGDFDDIPWAKHADMEDLPKEPGVYIFSPQFGEDDYVNEKLFKILQAGRRGVMFDEGASVPQREPKYLGLKTILAQGRGKRVPVIFATQRPRHVNKSLFSEGDYFSRFHLQADGDKQALAEFMPEEANRRLDDYHSHWYDVGQDRLYVLGPVSDELTLERFDDRLRPRRRLL